MKDSPHKEAERESLMKCGHEYGGSKEALIIALRHKVKDYPGLKGSLLMTTYWLLSTHGRQGAESGAGWEI